MSKKPFDKFINKESSGAKKKEEFKNTKRLLKAEAKAAGELARQKKKDKKLGIVRPEEGDKRRNPNAKFQPKFKNPEPKFKKKDGSDGESKFKGSDKPFGKRPSAGNTSRPLTPYNKADQEAPRPNAPTINRNNDGAELMPLNKLLAHSGVSGRREAAELIKQGVVTVNGDIIYEPGFKVTGNEDVKVKGNKIYLQHNLVYVLLNKPKDYITTAKDPEGRKTVYDLIAQAGKERIYPVGRLDRNTTGVLLFTNDGELAQKLTHPSYEIKKIYEVKLDKPVTAKDFEAITTGITLEDGPVKADALGYIDPKDKSTVGIEIHSGRNRIVRRIFEHLGYDVRSLDRVMFANLTKKNVDRGKWRFLNEKEVRLLKFMNQSFVKKDKEPKMKVATVKRAKPQQK